MNASIHIIFWGVEFPSDSWQYIHFVDELSRKSINFTVITGRAPNTARVIAAKLNELKKTHSTIIFLCDAFDWHSPEEALDVVRKAAVPSILLCYDNLQVPFKHRLTAKLYDLVWLTSMETEQLYRKWGATTIYLPYAANPETFRNSHSQTADNEASVAFVGTLYGARMQRIAELSKHAIPVVAYGSGEPPQEILQTPKKVISNPAVRHIFDLTRTAIGRKCLAGSMKKALCYYEPVPNPAYLIRKKKVSFEHMCQIYSAHRVILGTQEVWNTFVLKSPINKIHLRTFEVPMCGGIHLVNRTPELLSMYEDKKEILCYGSQSELVDLVKYYLADTQAAARQRIRECARNRSIAEHTWSHRFRKLFHRIGIANQV